MSAKEAKENNRAELSLNIFGGEKGIRNTKIYYVEITGLAMEKKCLNKYFVQDCRLPCSFDWLLDI